MRIRSDQARKDWSGEYLVCLRMTAGIIGLQVARDCVGAWDHRAPRRFRASLAATAIGSFSAPIGGE
jgi:hypothetical protein